MASLRKYPGCKFWYACFTLPDGARVQRSTRATDKKSAQKIADQYEAASGIGRQALLTERHARKVIGEIFEIANQTPFTHETTGAYFTRWLESKKERIGHKSAVRYAQLLDCFLKWLGPRRELGLPHLASSEIARFRDALASTHSPGTVNVALAVIQTALADAFNDGLVDTNEAARVQKLEESRSRERRAFTLEELGAILAAADPEWKGMILTSLYAGGMRLGDVADLQWQHIDLKNREIRFRTQKTGRQTVLPIAAPLHRYWLSITGASPKGPLFPRAFALRRRDIPTSALSNQFYNVLVAAGLAEKRSHHSTGKGRDVQRAGSELSFHSLRHTATTMLKTANVSDVIAREIVGHESEAVSRAYSHIDGSVLLEALNRLPDLCQ